MEKNVNIVSNNKQNRFKSRCCIFSKSKCVSEANSAICRKQYSKLIVFAKKAKEKVRRQCCESMAFWCGSGSGSADPCLWPMDPDPDADPAIFLTDLQDANGSGSATLYDGSGQTDLWCESHLISYTEVSRGGGGGGRDHTVNHLEKDKKKW